MPHPARQSDRPTGAPLDARQQGLFGILHQSSPLPRYLCMPSINCAKLPPVQSHQEELVMGASRFVGIDGRPDGEQKTAGPTDSTSDTHDLANISSERHDADVVDVSKIVDAARFKERAVVALSWRCAARSLEPQAEPQAKQSARDRLLLERELDNDDWPGEEGHISASLEGPRDCKVAEQAEGLLVETHAPAADRNCDLGTLAEHDVPRDRRVAESAIVIDGGGPPTCGAADLGPASVNPGARVPRAEDLVAASDTDSPQDRHVADIVPDSCVDGSKDVDAADSVHASGHRGPTDLHAADCAHARVPTGDGHEPGNRHAADTGPTRSLDGSHDRHTAESRSSSDFDVPPERHAEDKEPHYGIAMVAEGACAGLMDMECVPVDAAPKFIPHPRKCADAAPPAADRDGDSAPSTAAGEAGPSDRAAADSTAAHSTPVREAGEDERAASALPAVREVRLSSEELAPWMWAARRFEMNSDFALQDFDGLEDASLLCVLNRMVAGREDNPTMQILADKLLLYKVMCNLQIWQMPNLLELQPGCSINSAVETFVDVLLFCARRHARKAEAILKPTHLRNAEGAIFVAAAHVSQKSEVVDYIEKHVGEHLGSSSSSPSGQRPRPGFLAQPRYVPDIKLCQQPKLHVISLWGKVRVGVWWWGAPGNPAAKSHRNVWVQRRQHRADWLCDDDTWQACHQHPAPSVGFLTIVDLVVKHMPLLAAITERIAVHLGAPFLRAEFLLGSITWGPRLNRVSCDCKLDLRRRIEERTASSTCSGQGMVSDDVAIAQILCAGMAQCLSTQTPERFFEELGVVNEGNEITVTMRSDLDLDRMYSPAARLRVEAQEDQACALSQEQCETPRANVENIMMTITVPAGTTEGDMVAFKAPDGTELHVQIPRGRAVGDTFEVLVLAVRSSVTEVTNDGNREHMAKAPRSSQEKDVTDKVQPLLGDEVEDLVEACGQQSWRSEPRQRKREWTPMDSLSMWFLKLAFPEDHEFRQAYCERGCSCRT